MIFFLQPGSLIVNNCNYGNSVYFTSKKNRLKILDFRYSHHHRHNYRYYRSRYTTRTLRLLLEFLWMQSSLEGYNHRRSLEGDGQLKPPRTEISP